MLNWKLLVFNWCFWSSALVVDSAALTASQLDATDVCKFVKTSIEKGLWGKPDSLYISTEHSRCSSWFLKETDAVGGDSRFPAWKLISEFEPLARDFLNYCLKVPNKSKMEDICAQYTNYSLEHNNGRHETNYLNETNSVGHTSLISSSSNSENVDLLFCSFSPLQLTRTSTSLCRVFLTIYLAGNPGAYSSLDWKLTASEPIICVANPVNNTFCSTAHWNSDTEDSPTHVSVSMGMAPYSTENILNQYTVDDATTDFVDYHAYYRDLCAILLPNSTSNDGEFINCVSFYLKRFRNAILYRYNRLLIGQNVAYWHSGLLRDICDNITPNRGPYDDSIGGRLNCPSFRLRQRGVNWLKWLLCIGLILASFTTLLNFVLFWLLAFRRGRKKNRLRPYVLNIALIGTLWGLLDALDYSMMLVGYKMYSDPYVETFKYTWEVYYHCCSDNLWAPVPNYGSSRFRYGSSFGYSGTYNSRQMNLLVYSISIFLTTYTLQTCCMLTFVAVGVIQVYSLMRHHKRPPCMNKPKNNLCVLWVTALLISIIVTGPLAARTIQEVTVNSQVSQFMSEASQKNENTSVSSHVSLEFRSYLNVSADGDSLFLQASSLCGVVIAVLLESIDGLLAVALTVLVCYIRRSSSRAVGAPKKDTAGPSYGNDGIISAANPRTAIVLPTVIMASGISWISAIPMLHYLLTSHRLADTATCYYDVYSQAVTFDLAMTYLLGRIFLLLSPFANPILVAIRYRAGLFLPTIYGHNDTVPMGPNENSPEVPM